MNKHLNKYVIVALGLSVLTIPCLVLAYRSHTNAEAERAKYFSDLQVAENATDAIGNYISHHNGQLPNANHWEESIKPYWPDKNFTVSLKEHPGNRLAMNSKLSDVNFHSLVGPKGFFQSDGFMQPDGPILLYETHSDTKNTSGLPPWKECHQCDEATKERLMISFVSGWCYSYAEGSGMVYNKK